MNRMTHPFEQEEVMAYLDGELEAARAAAVAAHLDECAECAALAAELRGVSQHMAAWQVEPSPERLTTGVTAAVEQQFQAKPQGQPVFTELKPRRGFFPRWAWATAGGIALFLLIVAVSIPNLLRSRMGIDMAAPKDAAGHPERPAFRMSPPAPAPARGIIMREGQGSGGERSGGDTEYAVETGPMIVRTASLVLVAKDFPATRAALERIVHEYGGYLADLTTSSPSSGAQGLTAAVRVPAAKLDAALAELKKLGRVEQESQSGEEVTQQYVDLVARLKNARSTEQRLVQVLEQRTGKVRDVLEVEREIARVREEIERMEAQRKGLEKQVQFATVQLQVREEYNAQLNVTPPSTRSQLRNAVVEGYEGMVGTVLDLALFVLRAGPTLLFWGLLLFWPARAVWRRLRMAFQHA